MIQAATMFVYKINLLLNILNLTADYQAIRITPRVFQMLIN